MGHIIVLSRDTVHLNSHKILIQICIDAGARIVKSQQQLNVYRGDNLDRKSVV